MSESSGSFGYSTRVDIVYLHVTMPTAYAGAFGVGKILGPGPL